MKLTFTARTALLIGAFFFSFSEIVESSQSISSSLSSTSLPVSIHTVSIHEPVSITSLRSLQEPDTTNTDTGDLVQTEFSYGYELLYKITEQHPDVGAALTTVRDAVLVSLNQVIAKADANVQILFLASKETGACEVPANQLGSLFDGCTKAETIVTALISPDLDPLLVERVAILDIQTFTAEYNADNNDNIQILFEYPISVKVVIRVSLQGVDGTASTPDQAVIENTFKEIFGPLLQANDPSFTLSILQVLVQQASGGTRRLQQLRALQEDVVVVENNLDLYIRSTCEGSSCTDEMFESIVLEEFQGITQALEIALRAAGREAGSDYFETLTAVEIDESELNDVLPAALRDEYEQPEDEKIPAWVWIMLAFDVGILVLGMAWVTMHWRAKERLEMEEYDDKEREASNPINQEEYDNVEQEDSNQEEYDNVEVEVLDCSSSDSAEQEDTTPFDQE